MSRQEERSDAVAGGLFDGREDAVDSGAGERRALHDCNDPYLNPPFLVRENFVLVRENFAYSDDSLCSLSLSKEKVRERSDGRFTKSIRSGCGTAEFRLTSPAARDAHGDLSSK
jgi:hypothetical protein